MPRTARILLPDHIYHLTHRCHDGKFLLGFDVCRLRYRMRLWRAVREFRIRLLNYCITSNHTHLLIVAGLRGSTSRFMRQLEGEFALQFNRLKDRHGAFWSERFNSTAVEDGTHMWNCMAYIDLNMVRAGVVGHPRDWTWCGYQEITGARQRYRLLDLQMLRQLAGQSEAASFAGWYGAELNRRLETGNRRREPAWTESIAVGGESFVRRVAGMYPGRKRLDFEEWSKGAWCVRDSGRAAADSYSRRLSSAAAGLEGA